MKSCLVILLALISPATSAAPAFLSHSEIMKAKNLNLVFAQSDKNDILIPLQSGGSKQQSKFLLADDGNMYELVGKTDKKNAAMKNLCDPIDAVRLKLKNGKKNVTGQFVVLGENSQGLFQWEQAKKISGETFPALNEFGKNDTIKTQYYKVSGLKADVYSLQVTRKLSDSEKQACPTSYIEAVGLVSGGKRIVLNQLSRDCDGQLISKNGHSTLDFVGLLKVGTTEKWLIFKAEGYESQGYSAIRLDDKNGVVAIDEAHLWGC